VDTGGLVVSRGIQAQVDLRTTREQGRRELLTAFKVRTVRRNGVDLVARVHAPSEATACSAIGVTPDNDDIAESWCPFALNAHEPCREVENQVVPLIVKGWETQIPRLTAA
jgi:hypothetical protein